MTTDMNKLSREIQPMPAPVQAELTARGLLDAYADRPAYQRNDYLGWIGKAKGEDTRRKRIDQMLRELEKGDVYMNMDWSPGRGA